MVEHDPFPSRPAPPPLDAVAASDDDEDPDEDDWDEDDWDEDLDEDLDEGREDDELDEEWEELEEELDFGGDEDPPRRRPEDW